MGYRRSWHHRIQVFDALVTAKETGKTTWQQQFGFSSVVKSDHSVYTYVPYYDFAIRDYILLYNC
jgi:hypothetical protein